MFEFKTMVDISIHSTSEQSYLVMGKGNVLFKYDEDVKKTDNALCIPSVTKSMFSLRSMIKQGWIVTFAPTHSLYIMSSIDPTRIIAQGTQNFTNRLIN